MPGPSRPEIGRHYRLVQLARKLNCDVRQVAAMLLDSRVMLEGGWQRELPNRAERVPSEEGALDSRDTLGLAGRQKRPVRPEGKMHRGDPPTKRPPRKKGKREHT